MWPLLWDDGTWRIGTYGVVVGAGLLLCLWLARRLGVRDGLSPRVVNDIGLGMIVGGFVGSKSLGLAVSVARGETLSFADLRTAGAVHGGLFGGALTLLVVARVLGLPLSRLFDAYLPAAALGQAIGRLGCFFAGCCHGAPHDGPLSVVFTNPLARELGGAPLGVHLYPVQLYDAALHFSLCALLVYLHRRRLLVGRLLPLFCVLEGTLRFAIEGLRGDTQRGVWLNIDWLSTGRLTALALVLVGAVLFALVPKAPPVTSPSTT